MKKVKVMLAAIAILSVIGGTFAFKARNAFTSSIFTTLASNGAPTSGACKNAINNVTVLVDQPASNPPSIYYSTVSGACVTPTQYYTTTVE